MPYTDLNYGSRTIQITTTSTYMATDQPQLNTFLDKLRLLESKVGLSKVEIKLVPSVPRKFKYTITLLDGKMWKQDLVIPIDGSEDSMTFNVNSLWLSSELEFHREIRLSIISLIRFVPDLEDIEVNYI